MEKETERKGNGVTWAVFLIFAGVILLLNNLGLVSWSVWASLWKFWPLILVLGGLEIIFGGSLIGNFFVTILGLAAAFLLIFLNFF
ncbi:hypothetical protein C4578_01560 [Candidatus Microgenomates bacterium]|jgi:hypothetical protein|nr:MAG: hypothetical protein C4578_01560 [Candidatus Microgenomates bacterium]